MGTRRRRRLDVALLAVAAVLVGVAALGGAVAASTERVTRLWAGAVVGPGGAARIVESIDYDFGSRERHGIYRDVPGLPVGAPVQVASPTAPAQVEATGTAQQTRLRIGDPGRTVRGRHRYAVGYRLAGVAPGGRLAWDAVGTSWTVPIGEVEVHVVAPYRLEGARCVQGAPGSRAGCRDTTRASCAWTKTGRRSPARARRTSRARTRKASRAVPRPRTWLTSFTRPARRASRRAPR